MKKFLIYPALFILLFIHQQIYGNVAPSIESPTSTVIEDVYLKTPDFSEENIMGFNVGVRPYRQSGIRLEAESMDGKILIHNYGYGGSGLTLCFGGSQEVLSILEQEKVKNSAFASAQSVAVLGAGVIGLATAYDLVEKGYIVHLYADEFFPNLTSNVAAGIWSPPVSQGEAQVQLTNRLVDVSEKRFKASISSENPEFAGIRTITGYSFKTAGYAKDEVSHKFQHNHSEDKIVRVHFDNGVTKIGTRNYEISLDGQLFLNDLFAKTVAKGVVISQKRFGSKKELEDLNEEIIVNCTSLGSRELFNDQDFTPIRGHLVYFKPQAGIDYMMHHDTPADADYWMSMYPWSDRLIIGGLFEKGKEELQVDQNVINKLLQHARDSFQ